MIPIVALCLIWLIYHSLSVRIFIDFPGGYTLYNNDYGLTMTYGLKPQNRDSDTKNWPYIMRIGPNIGGYHVYSNVVVGIITSYEREDDYIRVGFSDIGCERRKGYFIMDIIHKKVYGGLSKRDWLEKLKTYGITTEPALHEPHWLDEYFGGTNHQMLLGDRRVAPEHEGFCPRLLEAVNCVGITILCYGHMTA